MLRRSLVSLDRRCILSHGHFDSRDETHARKRPPKPKEHRALADQRAFLKEVLAPGYDRSRCVQRFFADISTDYDFTKKRRQA